ASPGGLLAERSAGGRRSATGSRPSDVAAFPPGAPGAAAGERPAAQKNAPPRSTATSAAGTSPRPRPVDRSGSSRPLMARAPAGRRSGPDVSDASGPALVDLGIRGHAALVADF